MEKVIIHVPRCRSDHVDLISETSVMQSILWAGRRQLELVMSYDTLPQLCETSHWTFLRGEERAIALLHFVGQLNILVADAPKTKTAQSRINRLFFVERGYISGYRYARPGIYVRSSFKHRDLNKDME